MSLQNPLFKCHLISTIIKTKFLFYKDHFDTFGGNFDFDTFKNDTFEIDTFERVIVDRLPQYLLVHIPGMILEM